MKLFSQVKQSFQALTRFEWGLYLTSLCVVTISFFFGDTSNPLSLISSLVGLTFLILVAKGDVLGQVLTYVFCFLMFLFNDFYAFINWRRIQNRQQRFQFDAERK